MATDVVWMNLRHTHLGVAPRGREMPDGSRVGTEAALVFSADDVFVLEGSRARLRSALTHALRLLDVQEDEQRAAPWAEGDPDPTHDGDRLPGEGCPARHAGFDCTWAEGEHDPSWHVAGTGSIVAAVWPVAEEEAGAEATGYEPPPRDDDYTEAAVARAEAAVDEPVMERLDKTFGKVLAGDVLLPDGVDRHQRTVVTTPLPVEGGMVEFEVEYPSGGRVTQRWPVRSRHMVLRPRWTEPGS